MRKLATWRQNSGPASQRFASLVTSEHELKRSSLPKFRLPDNKIQTFSFCHHTQAKFFM
jgi:hypothetical protein